jgi:5,10-methylene-tetrahydrofolate dehydrogenase/methenyl tetrahydrofolate cyclohydrolase
MKPLKRIYHTGDVDFDNVSKKSKFHYTSAGGVGPMTIAMLMKNTLLREMKWLKIRSQKPIRKNRFFLSK